MFRTLISMIVCLSASFSWAEGNPQAGHSIELRGSALRGVTTAAELQAHTKTLLQEMARQIEASTATRAQKDKMMAELSEYSNHVDVNIRDIKTVITDLGQPFMVVGIILTYAGELIPARIGKFGFGGTIEAGVSLTFPSSGAPRVSFATIGGGIQEFYPEINMVQNRVGGDHGIHLKFILANTIGSVPNMKTSDLEGWYFGTGVDVNGIGSFKGYVGGCLKDDDTVRAHYPDAGWLKRQVLNCRTLMFSLSYSFKKDAPPIAIPLKEMYLKFFDNNGGDGISIFN